jgi:hypothetical protein
MKAMTEPTYPRSEPEIIPPGTPLRDRSGAWVQEAGHSTHYVYTARIGPIGATLLTLGVGAVAGVALLFLLSTAIIGLAAIGVLTVAGIIAGILRGPPRPLR